jgi:regulator of replication initiation timing
MAHGEQPRQPGYAEMIQLIAEPIKMLTNSIALQGQQFQKQTQQLTEGILSVTRSVNSTNARIDTEINPKIEALKEENEKLHSEKEYLRRRLMEHEAQAAEEAEGHKRRQLFNKIGKRGYGW